MDVTIPGHLFGQLPFFDVVDTAESVVVDLRNRPDLANLRGALQGGLVATLTDVAAGRLAVKYAGEGCGATTADISIHFLAPIVDGPARATASLVRAGRRMIVVAVDVTDVGRRSSGRARDTELRGAGASGAASADDGSVTGVRHAIERQLPVRRTPWPSRVIAGSTTEYRTPCRIRSRRGCADCDAWRRAPFHERRRMPSPTTRWPDRAHRRTRTPP